jgi:predicted MFS family arabinose efflux permease
MTSFSVATVAGVPAGLMFANLWGWHFAFFAIGVMCLGVGALAFYALPSLNAHIAHGEDKHVFHAMLQVVSEHNQRMALFLSATMMFAAFTIIPYITLYLQNNHVMTASEIPWLYFCGGVVTLFTGRWIGGMTDRYGKRETFQKAVLFSVIPMFAITLLVPVPLPFVLLTTTLLFAAMNGRMIPGMALLTSAANPKFRGTFMSLNGAVQSFSMGIASWVGGMLLQREPSGQVTHYWLCAVVAALAPMATGEPHPCRGHPCGATGLAGLGGPREVGGTGGNSGYCTCEYGYSVACYGGNPVMAFPTTIYIDKFK